MQHPSAAPDAFSDLMAAHHEVLGQLASVLVAVEDVDYCWHDQNRVASMGRHVRHLLEHYLELLAAGHGRLDYDARARDRLQAEALGCIERIRAGLQTLRPGPLSLAYDPQRRHGGQPGELPSSVERELHYLLSHTVHHLAMIGMISRLRGIVVPEEFGVAASTRAWRREQAAGS